MAKLTDYFFLSPHIGNCYQNYLLLLEMTEFTIIERQEETRPGIYNTMYSPFQAKENIYAVTLQILKF